MTVRSAQKTFILTIRGTQKNQNFHQEALRTDIMVKLSRLDWYDTAVPVLFPQVYCSACCFIRDLGEMCCFDKLSGQTVHILKQKRGIYLNTSDPGLLTAFVLPSLPSL